jgi:hypothetical protein
MTQFRPALLLAVVATGTAVCMSVLAGWQRGGWLSERATWIAVGVVLVTGAHLLPAFCRSAPVTVRMVGTLLWLGCIGAASYGHAMFFLLSQSHAGEARVSAVPVVRIPPHRDLAAVMGDRTTVTAELAQANARRCVRDCPALRVRRESLAARLDELDAEADEVRRYQTVEDRNAKRRDAARDDPVTTRLALLCGLAEGRLDLFAGLAFAAILEGMACLLWWIALMPQEQKSSVTDRHDAVPVATIEAPTVTTASTSTVTEPETEVTKLLRDIETGIVKPTVASIRRHLGCSQAKAAALRKQIVRSPL